MSWASSAVITGCSLSDCDIYRQQHFPDAIIDSVLLSMSRTANRLAQTLSTLSPSSVFHTKVSSLFTFPGSDRLITELNNLISRLNIKFLRLHPYRLTWYACLYHAPNHPCTHRSPYFPHQLLHDEVVVHVHVSWHPVTFSYYLQLLYVLSHTQF